MPLNKGSSEKSFAENVKQLIKDGYPRKQALAIAYDIKRRSKKKKS